MWSKLEYVDVWYSVPQPAEAERISSQRWHRDYNDKHLLKVFLYLVDVDDAMGPFQYVPGSQPGGPYADAWPWEPLGQNYPTEQELEALVPSSVDPCVHGAERHADLLQHRRLPSRRLLDDGSARARDRDLLLAGLARLADRAELRARRLAGGAGRSDPVRDELRAPATPPDAPGWWSPLEIRPRIAFGRRIG